MNGTAGGPIYTSTNSGASWVSNNAPSQSWYSVASSADGCKLAAVAIFGGIYTSQTVLPPILEASESGDNAVISWTIPSTDFVLQHNSDMSTTNWTDVPRPLFVNFTNLHHEVSVPLSSTNRFYRLKSH